MAETHDSTAKTYARTGAGFAFLALLWWVTTTAFAPVLWLVGGLFELLDLVSGREAKKAEPTSSGSGGVRMVAGLPLGSFDMPDNQPAQTDLINPPVASDVFMGKKIEGLRPVSKPTDTAQ